MSKISRISSWAISLLFGILFSFSAQAGAPDGAHWICHQVGMSTDDTISIALTNIFFAYPNDYGLKELEFEERVKEQTKKQFSPTFEGRCEDFSDLDKARYYLKERLKKYKKRGYKLFWIDFDYSGQKKASD